MILHLVAGTNQQGYACVLKSVWKHFDSFFMMPVKSSLSKIRNRISFLFFKEIFELSIEHFEPFRREFRGFRIYAIDGDQLELPCTEDILNQGYIGCPCPEKTETYYPRMYLSHAYDVISGVTKDFRYSSENNEVARALEMIENFEKNSITLYDRLYLSTDLIKAHDARENFFIARCKSGTTFSQIVWLFQSLNTYSRMVIDGVEVHLYKVKNPKTGETYVYATNLPKNTFSKKTIANLYTRRWEVETSFKDSTKTLKLEQWHSESFNGILQELYTHYWLINYCRMQISRHSRFQENKFLAAEYRKPNFKLITEFLIESIPSLIKRVFGKILRRLRFLLKRTLEKRKHHSRSYPRQVRSTKKSYKNATLIPRRVA